MPIVIPTLAQSPEAGVVRQEGEKSAFYEEGATGLRRHRGYIFEEFLPELAGARGRKVYREMATNDAVLASMLLAIEMLARKAGHRVEAASESTEDKLAAQFVEECRQDMAHTWSELLTENLSMLVYGWSWHEVVAKRRLGEDPGEGLPRSRFSDGKIGWRKIPIRGQDSLVEWVIDEEDGAVKGMQQVTAPDYRMRTVGIERSLLFRPSFHKGNPEGRSILRSAYRAWYFKRNIENIEAIGVERDLAGLPVVYVPPHIMLAGASPADKQVLAAMKRIVRNIRRDEQEGVVFPMQYDGQGHKLYELTLLATGGQRQFDTNKIVARYDTQMLMSALADFLVLGHQGVGSYSLSADKTDIFTTAMEGWLDSIDDVYNRFAIPRLFQLNGWQLKTLPKLVHGHVERVNLEELGNYIGKLAGAGATLFPDVKLEARVREMAGLPEPPTDLERMKAAGMLGPNATEADLRRLQEQQAVATERMLLGAEEADAEEEEDRDQEDDEDRPPPPARRAVNGSGRRLPG